MDHFQFIYQNRASEYHRMIHAEDVDGNLLKTIQQVAPIRAKRILDIGTGTARLPILLSAYTDRIVGLDLQRAMLVQNMAERFASGGKWSLVQGDMRRLPFPSASADLTLAGWAIGHLRSWFRDSWQLNIGAVIAEMLRVTSNEGHLVIMETLGTGSMQPAPPTLELAEYYAWLEAIWDFERLVIPTDYQFASVEEAIENTAFFFGAELAARIKENGWSRLPEWTGVWIKHV